MASRARPTAEASFVLDMGALIRILDIAEQMVLLRGLSRTKTSGSIVGLRPGDEQLFDDTEERVANGLNGVYIAVSKPPDMAELAVAMKQLRR